MREVLTSLNDLNLVFMRCHHLPDLVLEILWLWFIFMVLLLKGKLQATTIFSVLHLASRSTMYVLLAHSACCHGNSLQVELKSILSIIFSSDVCICGIDLLHLSVPVEVVTVYLPMLELMVLVIDFFMF